jgi:hypothetical protein
VVLVAGLLGASGYAIYRSVGAWFGDDARPMVLHGVRLGMTAGAVRARLDTGARGVWRAHGGDGLALEWIPDPSDRAAPGPGVPRHLRFELHDGLVVAVRAKLDAAHPLAAGAPFVETSGSVLERAAGPDGLVTLTLVARDCPTHADEVRALRARHLQ